ncbi:MAG: T9SS type A sorting domain-containing protein [Flavobacteriales bacterium]|nr:T9SS type A sorting domain-containing protein [Flavobacteriales bacterium]
MSVSPNPFRDECVIAFKATKTAKAVLNIIDMNGRPVAEAFNATVTKGQEVRVRFTADQVQRGIYQYSLLIGNEVVTGRLIVQ